MNLVLPIRNSKSYKLGIKCLILSYRKSINPFSNLEIFKTIKNICYYVQLLYGIIKSFLLNKQINLFVTGLYFGFQLSIFVIVCYFILSLRPNSQRTNLGHGRVTNVVRTWSVRGEGVTRVLYIDALVHLVYLANIQIQARYWMHTLRLEKGSERSYFNNMHDYCRI